MTSQQVKKRVDLRTKKRERLSFDYLRKLKRIRVIQGIMIQVMRLMSTPTDKKLIIQGAK